MTTTQKRKQPTIVLETLAPLAELVAIPPGSGLSTDDLSRVLLAIRSFLPKAKRLGYHIPHRARGECNEASDAFLHELEDVHGFHDGTIEHYDFALSSTCTDQEQIDVDRLRFPYTARVASTCDWHWAVRCGHLIIDWTARQFEPSVSFPAIWLDTSPGTAIAIAATTEERNAAIHRRYHLTRPSAAEIQELHAKAAKEAK